MSDPQLDAQIVAWLGRIDARLQHSMQRETPNLYLATAEPLTDKPLDSAICAHLEWRERLEELFALGATDKLDAALVAEDHHCAIGRWLHSDAAKRFAALPEFGALRTHHAAFHAAVGQIIRPAQQGDPAAAQAELAAPAYADCSWQVVNAIAALARAIAAP